MDLSEFASHEDEGEWNTNAELPAMIEIVRQCECASVDIHNTQTIINWYVFLKKNNVATFEEFVKKFAEGAKKPDFYEFSKYCIKLYREVHEEKLHAFENDPPWRAFIQRRMEGAVRMDQLGDEYHEDPGNDYWQRRASIVGPDYRELPRRYQKRRSCYDTSEDFVAAIKEFDEARKQPEPKISANRKSTAHAVRDALNRAP